MRSRWIAGALLGILVLAGSACTKKPNETARDAGRASGGRLVFGIQQEPEMLCSVLQLTKSSKLVDNCIFSRFVTWDDSLRLVPDLIREIPTGTNGGISPDNRTYTYHLRPGARWHDGHSLTSADVEFTYRVIMNPDCGAESQQGFDVVDRVETPDSLTVVFHLREPYASFVADTFSDEDVLPKHLLEGAIGPQFRDAPFHHQPVGSGPFRFVEWVSGSHIRVARFDGYYGDTAHLDEIVFKIVPDANALAVQLQAGEIDGYDQAEAAQIPLLEKLPGIRLYRTPSLEYEHLDFNCENPILSDVRVRRALAHATDRQALAEHVYEGLAEPARADVHPLSPWYNPMADTANAYDPARARSILETAGWRDTDGDGLRERDGRPLRLTISTTAGRTARERTEVVLQQQWRAAGVDLEIRNYNASVLFGSAEKSGVLRSGRFDVALFGWGQPPDPSAMEVVYGSRYMPPDGQNMGRFRNATFDSLAALGARLAAQDLRIDVYRQIEAILIEEVPVIPLVWTIEVDPVTDRLHDFRPNPTSSAGDTWNVNQWWLGESAL